MHQMAAAFCAVDRRLHPGREFKVVGFDPVAEDNAVLRHLRTNLQWRRPARLAEYQRRLGAPARERLAHGELKVIRLPGEAVLAQCTQLRTRRRVRDAECTGEDAAKPAGRAESGRDDDAARGLRLALAGAFERIPCRYMRARANEK